MNYKLFSIAIVFLFFLIQCQVSKPISKESVIEIQELVERMQSEIDAPGLSVAIVSPAGIQTFTAGYADQEKQITMQADHVLMNGSIGKTYVAAVALKLVEAGQLVLSDPIVKYLDDYEDLFRIPNADQLTVHHLMTHTSGIPRYIMDPSIWSFVKDDPMKSWTPEERLAYIYDQAPEHEPGKAWAYSDTNYILLGMIIEKVTGKSYSEVVQTWILEPNGLKETFVNDQATIPNLSAAYSGLSQLFQVEPKVSTIGQYTFNPQIEWTGGGISTTPADLATWTFLLHSGKVLSSETYQTMITSTDIETQFPDGSKYGHGCILWNRDGQAFYGHSGIMPGFLSLTEFSVSGQYALAIQVNTDRLARGQSLSNIATGIHEILNKKPS